MENKIAEIFIKALNRNGWIIDSDTAMRYANVPYTFSISVEGPSCLTQGITLVLRYKSFTLRTKNKALIERVREKYLTYIQDPETYNTNRFLADLEDETKVW